MAATAEWIYIIRAKRPGFTEEMLPEEEAAMSVHAGYLKQLLDEGTLILGGPCLDRAFGVAVFRAETEEEARKIAESDPAVMSGVMSVKVHPFRASFREGR